MLFIAIIIVIYGIFIFYKNYNEFWCNFGYILVAFLCNFHVISLLFCVILDIFSLLFCVKIWKPTFKLYKTAFKPSIYQLSNPAFKPSIIVYVSVYVCMYACVQVCRYPCVHVYMYTRVHVYKSTCIQEYMYTIIHNRNARLINCTNLYHKIIGEKNVKKVLT